MANTPKSSKPKSTEITNDETASGSRDAPSILNRRRLLLGGAAAAAATVTACGGNDASAGGGPAVHTGQRVTWRLASSFPRALDTIYGGAEDIANTVEELSGGRFKIHSYPAGEIVPGLQVLDAIQAGTVQVGHTASYYYTGKNPAMAFDTAVPFGLTARQQNAWLYSEGGDLMRELFSDFGVIPFPAGNTGTQMGGWFRKQVNDVGDLRGLKMRIPGLGAKVLSELGVTVQTIAGGETYQALERGAVDAAEWVGPYDDERLGFAKIAKNYYYPGWWEPGPNLSALVGQKAWDELPDDYKTIFKAAAYKANLNMLAKYDALNPEALTRIKSDGVILRPFSSEIMNACSEASRDLFATESAADPAYARIFESWDAYRERSNEWFGTAELSYTTNAFG